VVIAESMIGRAGDQREDHRADRDLKLDVGTTTGTVAAGDHQHSGYVS